MFSVVNQSTCVHVHLVFSVFVLGYTIHLAVGVFGGQSVSLHFCIGVLVFSCVLGYTIHLAVGDFGS